MAKTTDKELWIVRRVVIEHFEVEASSRAEAKAKAENPYSVYVKSESVVKKSNSKRNCL